jgi:hypothetical protein
MKIRDFGKQSGKCTEQSDIRQWTKDKAKLKDNTEDMVMNIYLCQKNGI